MKCNHCNNELKTDDSASAALKFCPFCGKNLATEEAPKFYENSKDALAVIMNKYGADVLLGKLNAHFSDFAPSVSQNVKGLVYAFYEKGAAQVLKSHLNASQSDKESAVKIAIKKLTEAYIVEDMAETIVYEFAAALGWQIGKPTLPKPELSKPLPRPMRNDRGNTTGNIANGGLVAMQGDWVYYANFSDGMKLYKMREDGSGNQKLCDDKCVAFKGFYSIYSNINVVGDWVYYVNCNDAVSATIYKIRTDGTGRQEFSSFVVGICSYVNVIDNWIYLCEGNAWGDGPLVKIRADGTGEEYLNEDEVCSYINVVEGWVYYRYGELESAGLYKKRIDGTGKQKLSDGECKWINVVEGWAYYVNDCLDSGLYKIRIDGTDKQKLYDDECEWINVSGDWIYCRIYDYGDVKAFGPKLHKIKIDGTGKQKLSDDDCSDINVVGDWVYYTKDESELYRVRIDGTDRQLVDFVQKAVDVVRERATLV